MIQVTVCIPTRNQATYLPSAVESALAQDVDDVEVLVHDDASTDETPEILAGFSDPRLRILRHADPQGIAANRNSCLVRARGQYVAWLDSDDSYTPGSLDRRLELLRGRPGVGLVHGAVELIDDRGRALRPWAPLHTEDVVASGSDAFRDLLEANTITTSTVVVRRAVQDAVGPFSTGVGRTSSDWDMWLRIALRSDLGYIAAPVARYRQHAGSISAVAQANGERLRCDLRVTRHVLRQERRRIRTPREAERIARTSLAAKAIVSAGDLYTAGRRRAAARMVVLAVRLRPRTAVRGLGLLAATLRGDDYGCYRASKRLLGGLADHLGPTRYGARIRDAATIDPPYEEMLFRAARRLREVTTEDSSVATVTKWDPTLLWLSRRNGVQFPDRRQMPDGYPRDGAALVGHLEHLRRTGITHLAFVSSTLWWLDHYPELSEHLSAHHVVAHRDDDCLIFDLRV